MFDFVWSRPCNPLAALAMLQGHLHPLIYMPNDQAEAAAALAAVVSAGTAGRAFLIVHAMEDTSDIL